MGSKPRHSSRRKKAGTSASSIDSKPLPSKVVQRSPVDFDAMLGRFSDALSIIATAFRALSDAQEESEPGLDHDIGEDITTLELGLDALRAVYDEFDVGIRELRA